MFTLRSCFSRSTLCPGIVNPGRGVPTKVPDSGFLDKFTEEPSGKCVSVRQSKSRFHLCLCVSYLVRLRLSFGSPSVFRLSFHLPLTHSVTFSSSPSLPLRLTPRLRGPSVKDTLSPSQVMTTLPAYLTLSRYSDVLEGRT